MTKPLALIVPVSSGSEPEILELEDCHQVYGDNIEQLFPEIDTPCEHPDAPAGQCHFNAVGLEPERCLYCGKRTG
jgi:hypothetical protein